MAFNKLSSQENEGIDDNPFAALFPSNVEVKKFCGLFDELKSQVPKTVNDTLERIFLFTLNEKEFLNKRNASSPIWIVNMSKFYAESDCLSLENIDTVLFERLLLSDIDPSSIVVGSGHPFNSRLCGDHHQVAYLFSCYERCCNEMLNVTPNLVAVVQHCLKLIIRNFSTCLLEPEVFNVALNEIQSLSIHEKLLQQLQKPAGFQGEFLQSCLQDVVSYICDNDSGDELRDLKIAFIPFLQNLMMKLNDPNMTLIDVEFFDCLNAVQAISAIEKLSYIMLELHNPHTGLASNVSMNIIGSILGKSALITNPQEVQHSFFNDLASLNQRGASDEEQSVHSYLDTFYIKLKDIFLNLIRNKMSRIKLLKLIGKMLEQHEYVGKMWTHQRSDPRWCMFISDALFMNLSAVMVQLCLPFCKEIYEFDKNLHNKPPNNKFLKIDPSYCVATGEEELKDGVNCKGLNKETCLLSLKENEKQEKFLSESYNFTSECFFMTQRCLHLGMHGLLVKFYRLNQELNRMGPNHQDEQLFKRAMAVYLSSKAVLSEPTFLENISRLHVTTACLLVQLAFTDDRSKLHNIELPLLSTPLHSLYYFPEFVVNNMMDHIIFLKRFNPMGLENFGNSIHYLLLVITIYMGNKCRMSNPHLRALIAEALEAILPLEELHADLGVSIAKRETAYNNFKYAGFLATSVIQLYVDIEFTGDPHQFEQKFNYRRPLYAVLKFLWKDVRCKESIKALSLEAVTNIENASPPLMLSFMNLFLNDSIFLLDETIDLLRQIKTEEEDKASGKWLELSKEEQQEKEIALNRSIQLAKFHNIMSNEIVNALSYLTTENAVGDLLCHPTLVERIASMLNYFLQPLVGPKMGTLKVQDFSHCAFKPQELVVGICCIYSHLGKNSQFCRAVSQDGRSYDSQLFPRTIRVLRKIGQGELCTEIESVGSTVKNFGDQQETEEEMLQNAPDEFFDPIMGTFMREPVILPSSNMTVDRTTIARHLLSDHSDPFNRQPLSMQEIKLNTELQEKINSWLAEQK